MMWHKQIVSAIREIGEQGFSEEYKSQIKPFVEKVTTADFEHDITLAPVWVRNISHNALRVALLLHYLQSKNRANPAVGTIFVCNLIKNLDISEK